MGQDTLPNNICIIGDASFDDEELFQKVMDMESFDAITHHADGRLSSVVTQFIRRHNHSVCALKHVNKLIVFYGGEDTSLIARMKKAEKNGIKVKIVKYRML